MDRCDVVVIGGGVAGLAAACALCRERDVLLLEREPLLAAHASGRNAAIFRPLEPDATTARLARDSFLRLAELGIEPLLQRCGLLLCAGTGAALDALDAHARVAGVRVERLSGAALHARAPLLAGGDVQAGLFVPEGGVLDIHAITSGLAAHARAAGARIRVGAAVERVMIERGRVQGVLLSGGGERVAAHAVVLAAGAWGGVLGAQAGAPLPLQPVRRHLVQLDYAPAPAGGPVVWRVDADELYFRPESVGLLASPCDAVPCPAGVQHTEPASLELLAAKLARSAPALSAAALRASWACQRTFAPDHELVVGPDPRVAGLAWLAGLGGRGMGVAVAAGELLARTLRGEPAELAGLVAPARLA